jgi:lysophospholipid hydrolase
VIAIRNSEACKMPANLLHLLKNRYPVVVSKLISLLGHRLLGSWSAKNRRPETIKHKKETKSSYSTVALYPSSTAVPLTSFSMELIHSFTVVGLATRLTSDLVREKLGQGAFEPAHEYRLNAWLGQQEHIHEIVIYQCDYEMTKWTELCLRQADIIFDLVLASQGYQMSKAEKALEHASRRVRKELVLIHHNNVDRPRGTQNFLRKRPWVSSHFHLKAPIRLFMRKSERNLQDFYANLIQTQVPNIHSDFSRLARHISGTSVGLVLGGGGARGAAHIGMLKAIQEAGIPIDKIGGVSIGAFVGGLWGSSRDMTTVTQQARSWFHVLAYQKLGPLFDFTYPICAIFTGAYFNSTLSNLFGSDLMIEDMWLPFFCCTTDISLSQERIHYQGIFWKYCRASMTYAWFLPPLCDPVDGHLLMDGCYVNNVPGDVMARQNCRYILAIDVTAVDDRNLTNYGDSLSGWWLLWKRWNPFAESVKIPDQSEIQVRLSFCSHYKNLEELKSNPNYEYILPPIQKYSSSQVCHFNIHSISQQNLILTLLLIIL